MRAAHPSSLHRLLTIGSAALLVMLGVFATTAPASAHSQLISSDPADGSTVEGLPGQIELAFSDAVFPSTSALVVDETCSAVGQFAADPSDSAKSALLDCRNYAESATVNGAIVTIPVDRSDAPAGGYTVVITPKYADGHSENLFVTFTVESASAESGAGAVAPENDETATPPPAKGDVTPTPVKETPSASSTPPAAEDEGDSDGDDRSFGEVLPWILLGVTGIAIVGALIAILASRGRGDDDDENPGTDPTAQG
ncbi:copper resistance protein CopC [Microbacterium paludicola]|uniref:copper resistance protein CopC n=1 Tax=Microbacterium paludicola TaxID=300019 RepID=UPI00387936B8